MAKIKLNPLVDLGLASDPNFNANEVKEVEVEVQNDLPLATPVAAQPVNTPTQSPSKPFEGIADISTFAPTNQTQATPQPTPVIEQKAPAATTSTSDSSTQDRISNILFILSISLFVVSVGALIFFALRFFRVI